MSSILDKLLKGQKVEWLSLGEVCVMKRGQTITSKNTVEGSIPVISGGQKPAYYHNEYNREGETITVAGSGAYAGFVMYWDNPIFVSDAFSVKPNPSKLLTRYVYHFLIRNQGFIYNLKKGAGIPHVYPKDLANIKIPIPPLDVQAKIVKILDAFTALTAELTAELTMREKQYHYYRDNLLTFSDDVEWKALGDVVLPTKNIKWKETNLSYQYIDLSSVDRGNNNIGETLEITSKNAPSRAQKIVKQDDIIFATTRPTQMRVAIIPKNFDEQIASTGYCILRANQKEILPKWIYYNLSLDRFKFYLEENQSGVAYPAISDGIVKEFQIPIPSLKEQKRIIEILDNFEIFNHSITEGLPKEIALRQQQYQYYREQLLDFPQ